MYIPFSLFLNYSSPFPWWFGPVLQVLGFGLLWSTRHTARMYPRWGRGYYAFSAAARPLGILMIGWAWVEICAYNPGSLPISEALSHLIKSIVLLSLLLIVYDSYFRIVGILLIVIFEFGGLPKQFVGLGVLPFKEPCDLMAVVFFGLAWSIWSIFHLGARQSFLYSRINDPIITTGPYHFQRHPQLFGALVMALASTLMVTPILADHSASLAFRLLNFAVMVAMVLLITRGEELDLAARESAYQSYRSQIPRFFALRRPGISIPFGKTLTVSIACYIAGIIVTVFLKGGFYHPNMSGDSTIYVSMDPAKLDESGWYNNISWNFNFRFKSEIVSYYEKNNKMPQDLDDWLLDHWQRYDFIEIWGQYPQTLFYCGQVFHHPESELSSGRHVRPSVVNELPFALDCNDDHVEFAQAMDYDGDGFPLVYMMRIQRNKDGSFVDRFIKAADDSSNTVNTEGIKMLRAMGSEPEH